MRRLSLFDVIVTLAVLILLVYLGSLEFPNYSQRTTRTPMVPLQQAP
jgi:hypothetical protein